MRGGLGVADGAEAGPPGETRMRRLGRAALYTSPMLRLLGHMILAVAVKA